ncbi:MAG: hypothetical protein PVJ92_03260 [Candidatus Dependentiae bacterium]|jgi:hypothetical protein
MQLMKIPLRYLGMLTVFLSSCVFAKVTFSAPLPTENLLLSYLQKHPEVKLPWLDDFCAAMQPGHTMKNRRGRGYIKLFFDKDIAEHVVVPLMRSRHNMARNSERIVDQFERRAPHLWYKWVEQTDQVVRNMFNSEAILEETYEIAEQVYQKVRGHHVVVLGQTPVYVGAMLQGMCEELEDTQTTISFIPFSGWPDLVSSNVAYKERIVYNLVTPFQEQCFYEVAAERGISPAIFATHPEQKLFVLDRSKGPSIASFAALVARWCAHENVAIPDMYFMHLGPYHKLSVFDEEGRMTHEIAPGLHWAIECDWVPMSKDVDACFDGEVGNELRVQPPFPALLWTPQHVESLFTKYPTAEAMTLFERFADYSRRPNEILQ